MSSKLKANKASQNCDFSTKIIKDNIRLNLSKFPHCLKLANSTPLYKNGKKDHKENYGPVSNQPDFSKTYERYIFEQMSSFLEKIISKY